MSLTTWKAEFYPIDADAVEVMADPIRHSLRKWRGLRPEALERHGMVQSGDRSNVFLDPCIRDDAVPCGERYEVGHFGVDSSSCACCQVYFDTVDETRDWCADCPLLLVRGAPCDERIRDDQDAPYQAWQRTGDPESMIALLEAALAFAGGGVMGDAEGEGSR